MLSASHIMIGGFLYEYMSSRYQISLHRESFIFGNILPDFRPSFLTRPHFLQYNTAYLKREIAALLADKHEETSFGCLYSMRMGVICHYLTDFFCAAHSDHFTCAPCASIDSTERTPGDGAKHGPCKTLERKLEERFQISLPRHMRYERQLHCYLVKNQHMIEDILYIPKPFSGSGEAAVFAHFSELHEKYLASRQSFGNDLVYALLGCVESISAITDGSLAVKVPEPLPAACPA
ncbi:MAG: zinc dependent phospholipase C family protein [Acetanaerobacterium sp.]